MPTIRLPNGWKPRAYQLPSWIAWERGIKRSILLWHRRAGKDEVSLHKAAVAAHQRVANYWHCLPAYAQARKAIWEAINPHTGKRRIDEAFPRELRKSTNEQEMKIEFKIGSIWRVVGSDNPDSLVGAPPAGIVFSEWAISNPSVWGYLAPILSENNGWVDFITTPRGRNHAKTMYDMARTTQGWFAETLTVDDTGAISLDIIEEQRKEYHALYGLDAGDALIQQEYWCSFEAAILGAYWARELQQVDAEGRITDCPYEPSLPVHTAWDLGVGDSTAIWFFQVHLSEVRVIDFYEAHGYGVDHYITLLDGKPYTYGNDYVPHDAKVREWTTGDEKGFARSRVEVLLSKRRKPKLVPLHSLEDGINAARMTLPRCIFDEERCGTALEALRQYRREWDDDKKVFRDKPLHDWTSHTADAFRYLAMAWRELKGEPVKTPKPILGIVDATFEQALAMQRPKRERV